jgi:hypothetical protein
MLEDKKENTIQTTIIYSREMKVKQTGEMIVNEYKHVYFFFRSNLTDTEQEQ